jgi:hypothetical protein
MASYSLKTILEPPQTTVIGFLHMKNPYPVKRGIFQIFIGVDHEKPCSKIGYDLQLN